MAFFSDPARAKQIDDPLVSKAKKRLERLDEGSILGWADMAGTGIAKALDDYRRTRSVDALEEAKVGAAGLVATVNVLLERARQ